MSNKRTLALTHEQVEVLQDALSVAERYYVELHSNLAKFKSDRKIAMPFWDKATSFLILKQKISNSELDV